MPCKVTAAEKGNAFENNVRQSIASATIPGKVFKARFFLLKALYSFSEMQQ